MGKIVINAVLPTETKMFCGCAIAYDAEGYRLEDGESCPVCRKEEGTFPILNKTVVEKAMAVILALHGTINQYTLFDRVKSESGCYDILSQYSYPMGKDGYIEWKSLEEKEENGTEGEASEPDRIQILTMRLKESEEEAGIPILEITSDKIEEELLNPIYIEEVEKILLALGLEEWEIIETDELIESMEAKNPISYLPDPDLPPVIISQWWIDQIAAKYPDLIQIEEPEIEDEDDF